MKKWEYKVQKHEDLPETLGEFVTWLKEMGNEGWELVAVGTGPTVFKREVERDYITCDGCQTYYHCSVAGTCSVTNAELKERDDATS